VHPQGAQGLYNITPDLTCFGKVIGAGMPVGAFGGKQKYMDLVAPAGPVYQAGTLSGNPVAMAAGIANLELIAEPGFYDRLSATTESLADGLQRAAEQAGVPMATVAVGGMFGFFFTDTDQVTNFDQAANCDMDRFKRFFTGMLEAGVYLAPSAFEAGFVSAAHTPSDVDETLAAAARVLAKL